MSDLRDPGAAEQMLLTAEITSTQPVWRSSNYVLLCRLGPADGDGEALAIYKPRRGESPLWDFPEGTLFRREVAAYRLAKLLGWPVVPPTVIREGPQGVGSLQLFVEHDPNQHFFVLREDEAHVGQLKRLAVYDAIANNADRKGGHCLLDGAGSIWGIDHGVCFHEEDKLRTVIWDWAAEPIAPELLADVESAFRCLEIGSAEAIALAEVLSEREMGALVARVRRVLASGHLPVPGPYRPYPWPLI